MPHAELSRVSPELGPDDLYRRCDPREIPFDSTAVARETIEILGQERAVDAARFAIGIKHEGYNLFALGPAGIGKQTMLLPGSRGSRRGDHDGRSNGDRRTTAARRS